MALIIGTPNGTPNLGTPGMRFRFLNIWIDGSAAVKTCDVKHGLWPKVNSSCQPKHLWPHWRSHVPEERKDVCRTSLPEHLSSSKAIV